MASTMKGQDHIEGSLGIRHHDLNLVARRLVGWERERVAVVGVESGDHLARTIAVVAAVNLVSGNDEHCLKPPS